MVMTETDWAGWLKDRWEAAPADADNGFVGWVIVKRDDKDAGEELGPVFKDEETARHICRAHNHYISALVPGRETSDGGSEPTEP
jgi:hypothetical protein